MKAFRSFKEVFGSAHLVQWLWSY